MKKIITITLLLLAFAVSAHAAAVSKIIFANFTSASSVTCYVWGMNQRMATDAVRGAGMQTFVPDTTYSRSYVLSSAHAYGNYSTVYTITPTVATSGTVAANLTYAQWSCVDTSTMKTNQPVKVYLNSLSNAVFMPNIGGIGGIGIGYNRLYN